ncbi:hypothetical protein DFH06DRAFT_1446114 [Mycena polygramma]|nr:hypothetical protein DFH06DRAFT_1446114 [Mycena polygramma]
MARGRSIASLAEIQQTPPPATPPPQSWSPPLSNSPLKQLPPLPLPARQTTIVTPVASIAPPGYISEATQIVLQSRIDIVDRHGPEEGVVPWSAYTPPVWAASAPSHDNASGPGPSRQVGGAAVVQRDSESYFPAQTSIGGTSSPSAHVESPQPEALLVPGWAPFFTPEIKTTPVFVHLMNAIFTYLDTKRTGTLSPEVYSRFLINQGLVGPENTWHVNLIASLQSKEDTADAALRCSFDLLGIEYVLHPRPPKAATADTMKRHLKSFARALTPSASGGLMPLLTRKGFTALTVINILCNPERHWRSLAVVVRMYDLPEVRGWGELPRGAFPDEAEPRVTARMAQVQLLAKEQGQFKGVTSYAKSQLDKVDARDAVAYAKDKWKRVDAQSVADAADTVTGVMLIGNVLAAAAE